MEEIGEYWIAVWEAVCRHCIDADGDGNCQLGAAKECALRTFFPRLVQAVTVVNSDNYPPYVEKLRETICSICSEEDSEGFCGLRRSLDCALDRYYPMVIGAIEEVNMRAGRAGLAA